MSVVDDMLRRYKEIRLRLQFPPNAVPDTGINLRRHREQKPAPPPAAPLSIPQIILPEPVPKLPPIVEQPVSGATFSSTLSITAKEFGLSFNQIRAKSRIQKVVFPRQVAIYIACKQQKWSVSQIGHYLNLDHTTAMHARNKIASKVLTDLDLKDRIKQIEDKIAALYPPPLPDLNKPSLAQGSEGTLPQPSLCRVDSTG